MLAWIAGGFKSIMWSVNEGVFDRAADSYGLVGPDQFAHFSRWLVDGTPIAKGAVVLDLACGPGGVMRAVLDSGPSVTGLLGVDLSYPMLERARREVHAHGVHVAVAQMDGHSLAFADGAFDTVLSSLAINSLAHPVEALNEVRRVLRVGGTLGICVAPGWWFQGDPKWTWLTELLEGHQPQPGGEIVDERSLHAVLQRAGFNVTSIATDDYLLWFRDSDEWWRWVWSHGSRCLFESLKSDHLRRVRLAARHQIGENGIAGRITGILATATR